MRLLACEPRRWLSLRRLVRRWAVGWPQSPLIYAYVKLFYVVTRNSNLPKARELVGPFIINPDLMEAVENCSVTFRHGNPANISGTTHAFGNNSFGNGEKVLADCNAPFLGTAL